ncbi:VirB8/TrbF family protein [Aeromonas caviae]|uniref:VirB8/TrbF family protein n=1 Tax=Aeromonas caviae TaxID=648 RepID=UPI003F7B163D
MAEQSKSERDQVEREAKALSEGKIEMESEIVSLLYNQAKSSKLREVIGWAIGIIGIVSAASMLPLQKTDLFIIKPDPNTGYTSLVKVSGPEDVTGDEVMDAYWAENYVMWRESYNFGAAQVNYDRTMLLSSPEEQRKYDQKWAGDDAIDKKYGSQLDIEISDITAIVDPTRTPMTAVVRYKASYKYAGRPPIDKRYVATFSYSYDPTAVMSQKDRKVNPANYRVDSYVTNEEGGR